MREGEEGGKGREKGEKKYIVVEREEGRKWGKGDWKKRNGMRGEKGRKKMENRRKKIDLKREVRGERDGKGGGKGEKMEKKMDEEEGNRWDGKTGRIGNGKKRRRKKQWNKAGNGERKIGKRAEGILLILIIRLPFLLFLPFLFSIRCVALLRPLPRGSQQVALALGPCKTTG